MDPKPRCKASVHISGEWRPVRCSNRASRDGYCTIHHPDTVAARNEKKLSKWEAEARERTRKWALERAAPEMFALLEDYGLAVFSEVAVQFWDTNRKMLLDRIKREMGE